jgi:hypothetical protein
MKVRPSPLALLASLLLIGGAILDDQGYWYGYKMVVAGWTAAWFCLGATASVWADQGRSKIPGLAKDQDHPITPPIDPSGPCLPKVERVRKMELNREQMEELFSLELKHEEPAE